MSNYVANESMARARYIKVFMEMNLIAGHLSYQFFLSTKKGMDSVKSVLAYLCNLAL